MIQVSFPQWGRGMASHLLVENFPLIMGVRLLVGRFLFHLYSVKWSKIYRVIASFLYFSALPILHLPYAVSEFGYFDAIFIPGSYTRIGLCSYHSY